MITDMPDVNDKCKKCKWLMTEYSFFFDCVIRFCDMHQSLRKADECIMFELKE